MSIELENNINTYWEVIEEEAGNGGTLSIYFLYYVVYSFNYV